MKWSVRFCKISRKIWCWKFELIASFSIVQSLEHGQKLEESRYVRNDSNRALWKIGANRVCRSKRIWSSTNWSMNNGTGHWESSKRSRTVHHDLSGKLSCRLTRSRRFTGTSARSTEKLFQGRLGLLIFKGIRSKRFETTTHRIYNRAYSFL